MVLSSTFVYNEQNENGNVKYLPEVSKWLLEKGLAQHRIESFQSQKDARDRDGFLSLSEEMQQELNRENRYASQ